MNELLIWNHEDGIINMLVGRMRKKPDTALFFIDTEYAYTLTGAVLADADDGQKFSDLPSAQNFAERKLRLWIADCVKILSES